MCFQFMILFCSVFFFFFFNDTATTEIYTLSLHDALPIWRPVACRRGLWGRASEPTRSPDRKSTRLNSSHLGISYAVFCLKKKNKKTSKKHKKKKKKTKITKNKQTIKK